MARVLVPLPDRDFDTTEVTVPWHVLARAGHELVFATESATVAACDPLLLRGVIFGELGAKPHVRDLYSELERSDAFRSPIRYDAIDPAAFDALILPGGHAPGMKQYLESEALQSKVVAFAKTGKPIGAICHGVLVLARAKDPVTGKSVLYGRKTTCLPKYLERIAYFLTAWKLGPYYRTYDAYVEDEVRDSLAAPPDFVRGPLTLVSHGTADNDRAAFVVEDGAYVSARWPGDAYLFAKAILARLP